MAIEARATVPMELGRSEKRKNQKMCDLIRIRGNLAEFFILDFLTVL